MTFSHQPVLLKESLHWWGWKPGGFYVDGTLGLGGHTEALLNHDPQARCLGLDKDPRALASARERLGRFKDRVTIRQADFKDARFVVKEEDMPAVDGVLLDLGVSSMQLDDATRGFSFMKPGPMDMRMNPEQGESALDLIRRLSANDLADVIERYGEERFAKLIALELKKAAAENEIKDTVEWGNLISKVVRSRSRGIKSRIHDATRTFQALRIAVNRELESLEMFLNHVPEWLAPQGRAAVISFHSLEDRMVKNAFRNFSRGCVCPPSFPKCVCGKSPIMKMLTRKAVTPSEKECDENPRSRSAKLRVAEKL